MNRWTYSQPHSRTILHYRSLGAACSLLIFPPNTPLYRTRWHSVTKKKMEWCAGFKWRARIRETESFFFLALQLQCSDRCILTLILNVFCYQHSSLVGHHHKHKLDLWCTRILEKGTRWFHRGVCEAIPVAANSLNLNRDEGRHQLPLVYRSLIWSCDLGSPTRPHDWLTVSQLFMKEARWPPKAPVEPKISCAIRQV